MSTYSSQLSEEQQAVDCAYGRLDDLRSTVRTRLDAVRAAGSHGSPTQRTERDSFATMYEDRLTQLRAVEDRLVFGRLDDREGTRHYIGRIGLLSENHDPILTDWRAEAARPFYEATPRHHGNIVMRRHITLKFREVVGVEDEILDIHADEVNKASKQGTLTGEGALLASLGSRRTGKMTDIVATIQAEQDRIIRAPLDHTIVVQGGPGTGKTAVALHRAAYLLYTHRRKLEKSGVLIVGPSSAFLRYIDQVLPSLGETGVVSRTISD
ncbi:MAG: ATP-dependent DNA helicase, partial [Gardnerella vaginalis]